MNIHSSYLPSYNETVSFIDSSLFNSSPNQPLTKGDQAPAFTLPATAGKWTQLPEEIVRTGKVVLNNLQNSRPFVLSFYSPHWNHYGHQYLQSLIDMYAGIKALGGEMLVLTPEPIAHIYHLAKHYQIPFSIAQDANHLIAYQYGIYDTQNPVWQRIAGITADVPAPATYVIAPNGQITAAFVDTDFRDTLLARPVLSAVYTARDKRIKKAA